MRDWLDNRTGFRALLKHLLDEPLPSGVGWWFVTGSVVMFLLTVQLLTGVLLAIFYSPSPDHAYDSVRFIMERVTFGRILRGLHFFGASFIVVAAVVQLEAGDRLRVAAIEALGEAQDRGQRAHPPPDAAPAQPAPSQRQSATPFPAPMPSGTFTR